MTTAAKGRPSDRANAKAGEPSATLLPPTPQESTTSDCFRRNAAVLIADIDLAVFNVSGAITSADFDIALDLIRTALGRVGQLHELLCGETARIHQARARQSTTQANNAAEP